MKITLDLSGDAVEQLAQVLTDRLTERLSKQAENKEKDVRNDVPELLSRKQAAKLLGISLPTLALWSSDTPDRSALITAYRFGRTVRYHKADVLNSLKVRKKFQRIK